MPTNHRVHLSTALLSALLKKHHDTQHINYPQFVDGLGKGLETVALELHHATTGMCGEAGEALDITKKLWIYEKALDEGVVEHLIEELGDLRWYYQAALNTLGITDEMVVGFNKTKLLKRYPGGVYSNAAAQARADKVEAPETPKPANLYQPRKFFGQQVAQPARFPDPKADPIEAPEKVSNLGFVFPDGVVADDTTKDHIAETMFEETSGWDANGSPLV